MTADRKPLFSDLRAGRAVVGGMQACRNDADTLCFVVMPDHVHWMLQLGTSLTLNQIVSKAKARATRSLRSISDCPGSIWQRSFHDRRIRPNEDLRSVARYVIENPVRAGLVASVRNYPLWDACWL